MSALGRKLNEYWDAKKGQPASQVQPQERPDWTWAQCDNCLKWRRMPDGVTERDLPESWYCRMNLDLTHNRCDVPEEPEDEDELLNRATYQKVAPKPKGPKKISAEAQMKMMQLERELMEREQQTRQQEQLIQSLNHEKLVIEKQLHERSAQQLLGAVSRKGGAMPVSMFKGGRPAAQGPANDDLIITQNSSGSDSDDVKPSTSGTYKRKMGRHSVSDDVIMIDSDSDDEEPPAKKNYTKSSSRDVKPDVSKLNKQMTKDKNKTSGIDKSAKDNKPNKEALDAVNKSENGSDCIGCKENGAQVKEMEKQLKGAENTLSFLRKHVWELMQVIVPDLELENLEMVDQVVVEMVRVNKQSPENGESALAGTSSESGGSRRESVNGDEDSKGLIKVKEQTIDNDLTQDPSVEENGDMCNTCNGAIKPSETVNGKVKVEENDSQSKSIITNGKSTNSKDRS